MTRRVTDPLRSAWTLPLMSVVILCGCRDEPDGRTASAPAPAPATASAAIAAMRATFVVYTLPG